MPRVLLALGRGRTAGRRVPVTRPARAGRTHRLHRRAPGPARRRVDRRARWILARPPPAPRAGAAHASVRGRRDGAARGSDRVPRAIPRPAGDGMSDLHEAFDAWLTRGARDDLPRAVALHASACPGCLQAAGAFDALTMIDLGAAELPPLRVAAGPRDRRRGLVPATAAAVAVLLVVGAGIVAGETLLRPPDEPDVAAATPTLAEGVLGGQGGPQASATESATPTASPTSTPSESPEESTAAGQRGAESDDGRRSAPRDAGDPDRHCRDRPQRPARDQRPPPRPRRRLSRHPSSRPYRHRPDARATRPRRARTASTTTATC